MGRIIKFIEQCGSYKLTDEDLETKHQDCRAILHVVEHTRQEA